MDALAEAREALERAKADLFEKGMNLTWEMKITHLDIEGIRLMRKQIEDERRRQNEGNRN